ncbi:DUF6415 family natural product biosynthesis protein [Streptomyces sp. NPDC002537]
MPFYPGTAVSPLSPLERPSLQHRLARAHSLVPAADALDRAAVDAVIRGALDRLPLADVVDDLIAALTAHLERLVPVVEAKDWASHGQDKLVGLILGAVRTKLATAPAPDADAAVRAVYAQELARTCRGILGLALVEPGDGA